MSAPLLDWHVRMGRHEAVFQDRWNRLVCWTLIPIQILAVFIIFSGIEPTRYKFQSFGFIFPFNLSFFMLLSICALYCRLDVLGGCVTGLVWFNLLIVGNFIYNDLHVNGYELLVPSAILIVASVIHVHIGYRSFEEGALFLDNAFAEFMASKNPLYLLCIPFYHNMEFLFMLGFRPDVCYQVRLHQEDGVVRARGASLTTSDKTPILTPRGGNAD